MAHLYRLIRALLFVLALVSGVASAGWKHSQNSACGTAAAAGAAWMSVQTGDYQGMHYQANYLSSSEVSGLVYWESVCNRVSDGVSCGTSSQQTYMLVCAATCESGLRKEIEASVGWVKEGGVPYTGISDPACVMVNSANACKLSFGGISVMFPAGPIVNGSRQWFMSAQGTLTGGTCTPGEVAPVSLPGPACVGPVGTVNGVEVCLPAETQAEKELRAQDAASKAAKLATDIATAAGKTPSEIAAAGAAAGAAAAAAIRNGQTPTSAAAAGAAAGTSANTLGATPSSVVRDAVKAAAEAEARAQATAAGKTQAQIDAAGVAARNAAGAAWDSGSTTSGAASAGAAAGSAAANGASAGGAAAAGAGAAASEGAGDGEGEGEETESNWGSGPCATRPVCEGDAIQCAIAKISFDTDCRLQRPLTSPELDAYDAAKVLTGDQTKELPGNASVNISSGSFDSTEFLGGASGMSDLTITVAGRSVLLPFSMINIWLARLGMLLQAVTFILCVRIVSRG